MEEFSDEKERMKQSIIKEVMNHASEMQMDSSESNSRRESLLSSFNESDINEGERIQHIDYQKLQKSKEVKTCIMSQYKQGTLDNNYKEDTFGTKVQAFESEKISSSNSIVNKVFEIKKLPQP